MPALWSLASWWPVPAVRRWGTCCVPGCSNRSGWWTPASGPPRQTSTDFAIGDLRLQPFSTPGEWSTPPAFPSGASGLLSSADDFLAFAGLLVNHGTHRGQRLLSTESVARLTTNHLTPDQLDTAGILLHPRGWGYGMAVATEPDDVSAIPGRYGWEGGYGTVWFNDPYRDLIAIALTQTSDFLFNGGRVEFTTLAVRAAD